MRRLSASLMIAALGVCAIVGTASASDGDARRISNEPAATLLIPYFEAQVPKKIGGKPSGITTLVTIGNASASAGLVHVTVWSDLSVPVLGFDVYLTGYDLVTFDMQDVLNGKLPFTADAGQDPQDTTSPHGPESQDINFPGATGPCGANSVDTPLDTPTIEHVRAALTGKFSPVLNGCAGLFYPDKKPIARGYITVDDLVICTELNPDDPAYYASVGSRNIWFGEYTVLDKQKKVRRTDLAAHVRAEGQDALLTADGSYAFYRRFEGPTSTSFRQPLATTFFVPFDNAVKDPLYPQGTSYVVWRDPKVASTAAFDCNTKPSWYPLHQDDMVAFDEQENAEDLSFFPPTPPAPPNPVLPFPAATQKAKLDTAAFPVSFTRGQIYLNLNDFVAQANDVPSGTSPGIMQNWVTVVRDSKSKYSVGTRGIHLDSATATNSVVIIP